MNDGETRRKSEQNKLPFRLKVKKYKMLFSYHAKRFKNNLNAAYLIFLVNIVLFSLVLIPNLAHRLPVPIGSWPIVLQLHGTVCIRSTIGSNKSDLIPAFAVEITIGGYDTTTDTNGQFHVTFSSRAHTNIPVVFSWSNKTGVKWISFEPGQFEKTEVFVLE